MSAMFANATVFNKNIGSWKTSAVTNMSSMFYNAIAFNNNGSNTINDWDTSGVTTMDSMFNNATAFNQNISGWNVSNVIIKPPPNFSPPLNFSLNSSIDNFIFNQPRWIIWNQLPSNPYEHTITTFHLDSLTRFWIGTTDGYIYVYANITSSSPIASARVKLNGNGGAVNCFADSVKLNGNGEASGFMFVGGNFDKVESSGSSFTQGSFTRFDCVINNQTIVVRPIIANQDNTTYYGVNGPVYAIVLTNDYVIFGGSFTDTVPITSGFGSVRNLMYIGYAFLTTGIQQFFNDYGNLSTNGQVNALILDVYLWVGGTFTAVGNTNQTFNYLARTIATFVDLRLVYVWSQPAISINGQVTSMIKSSIAPLNFFITGDFTTPKLRSMYIDKNTHVVIDAAPANTNDKGGKVSSITGRDAIIYSNTNKVFVSIDGVNWNYLFTNNSINSPVNIMTVIETNTTCSIYTANLNETKLRLKQFT